jgi:hypothetical protein
VCVCERGIVVKAQKRYCAKAGMLPSQPYCPGPAAAAAGDDCSTRLGDNKETTAQD